MYHFPHDLMFNDICIGVLNNSHDSDYSFLYQVAQGRLVFQTAIGSFHCPMIMVLVYFNWFCSFGDSPDIRAKVVCGKGSNS